jgi:hypothetical protein
MRLASFFFFSSLSVPSLGVPVRRRLEVVLDKPLSQKSYPAPVA